MSSHPYYDSRSQCHASDSASGNSDSVAGPHLWEGVDTGHTPVSDKLVGEKPISPHTPRMDSAPSALGPSTSFTNEQEPASSGKKADSSRKSTRGESRPRRTYACGPCKRYKMKCNLDTPCHSCVTSKRIDDCLKNPANPPSEEEKSKIERRRRRNSRKKDLEQSRSRAPKVWPEKIDDLSPCAFSGSPRFESLSSATSESSPNAIKTLSPMGRDYVFNLNVPLATDFVAPPPCHVRRVQNYKFMKEYAIACQQQTAELSYETAAEIADLLRNISYDSCIKHFQKYADIDGDGVPYLVDIKDYFNVAHNLILKCQQIASGGTVVFDGFSMRSLSLTALVFAYKEMCEGHFSRSKRWVKVSQDSITALGELESFEDLLHLGIWVVMMKFPLVLGSEYTRILSLCERTVHLMSKSAEVMQYLRLPQQEGAGRPLPASELDILTQKHSNSFKKRGDHDKFVAVARIWSLLKFFEVEINIVSACGTLQLKYMHEHATIQPNEFLLSLAFGKNLSKLQDNWTFFQFILAISGRFFCRFDHFSCPTDLIYSYLTLYNDLHSMLEPTQARLYAELPLMEPVTFIEKYCDTISLLIMKYYLNVRWLTITKVEKPHFPSLRFAHYVSNLMVLHRLMQVLDARLATFAGVDYDPAYLDDNSQVNVYLVVLYASKNMLVFQVLNNTLYQALFLAVLSQFVQNPQYSAQVDLSYIFGQVHDSLTFARAKLEAISVLRDVPTVADILSFVRFFHDFAMRPTFHLTYLPDFLNHLSMLMTPTMWKSLSITCFGSTAKTGDYIGRLWEFFTYFGMITEPFKVSNHLCVDTAFFRGFENSMEPFNFPIQLVDDYIRDVVLPASGI